MKRTTAREIAELIACNTAVIPGGFGCCGHPDLLTEAISERFHREQKPTGLTLLFASGAGDKQGKGLDKLADPRLVRRAIGGFWGFCPAMTKLGKVGEIEAHNWPMGVISHLFRDMASGLDGHFSHVGLHTFVDPQLEGGVLDTDTLPLVEKISLHKKELLYYPSPGADFTLLRGTLADEHGNISMMGEAALHDALWQAMATRNNGGKIAFQVERVVHRLPAEQVDIPGHLVDYVVESGNSHYPSYGSAPQHQPIEQVSPSLAKKLIIHRACLERLPDGAFVNFGIGIPALVGARLDRMNKNIITSVESGVINGKPKSGLAFGEATEFSSILQQADLFSFYNGGGIDVAFLGFAEIDRDGNVNASSFGDKYTGAGGFINIATSAKKIVFCGTMTTRSLLLTENNGTMEITQEGEIGKFVEKVQQVTAATNTPLFWSKEIIIITERAVFSLHKGELTLKELTMGITIDMVVNHIPFPILISQDISNNI
ncbi:CoA-transferase [Aeromonas bivalvium]|uniref:CoA-transferase n=1 Tax=Aeromonas bivalvium TaxID=440079 RepID=UPI0005A83648|nr:CoA-transferase [Aeromonas bivalvium]